MRLPRSCVQCRISKRKCQSQPGSTSKVCKECLKRKVPCTLDMPAVSSSSRPLHQGPELKLPEQYVLTDVVERYFATIHDVPHSLFHKASFMDSVKSKKVHQTTIYAIIGLAARFSKLFQQKSKISAHTYFEEAKRMLRNDLENVCIENVQAAIIVTNICFSVNQPSVELMYVSMAIRMGQLLRLGEEDAEDSVIQQELKRRVWWSLYMLDRWSSSNHQLPRLIYEKDSFSISLPMGELQFQSLGTATSQFPDIDPEYLHSALWAEMIVLARIFDQIQNLNEELVSSTNINYDSMIETVTYITEQLDDWKNRAKEHLQFNVENLNIYGRIGLARPFVSLHYGYHHYSILLYFQFLDETQSLSHIRKKYSQLCFEHAKAQSNILALCLDPERDCMPLFNTMGHMIVISSSVLLHSLMFGNSTCDNEKVKTMLEYNHKALDVLKGYWDNVDNMINRLKMFQNVCKLFSYKAFQLDQWTLKFLLQYSISAEKNVEPESLIDMAQWDILEESNSAEISSMISSIVQGYDVDGLTPDMSN